MLYNTIELVASHGFRGRGYIITNSISNIDDIPPELFEATTEYDPSWDGNGVKFNIMDGGELITLQMLKDKRTELETEEPYRLLRELRDKLLAETDYLMNSDYPHATQEIKQAWIDYRQSLRDLPENTNPQLDSEGNLDMTSFTLPEKPV